MAIKTNHSTETLTPESGVLTVNADGALRLPVGPEISRPNGVKGYIRVLDGTDTSLEYYNGVEWKEFADKSYVESRLGTGGTDSIDTILTNLRLDDLADVTITTPTDGQVLVYDVATGEFRTQTQAMSVITRTFTADGSTFDFDIQTTVSSIHNIVVTVNGIQQEPFYSFILTNGNIVTFDEAPESGDKIQVKILRTSAQTDRPRPSITSIIYGSVGTYTTITLTATDTTYGVGVKIGNRSVTRIDYIAQNQIQVMIETSLMNDSFWNNPQDLTLIDTSGNEFVYYNLISYGTNKPHFTNSNGYIGTFSAGDSINFALPLNNSTSTTLGPAYAGETAISWLSLSGSSIVGTAPTNSNPSRYEISVTASNGSVNITKNYWLLVV